MPINLLYHDVSLDGNDDASGFPGAEAARYKLSADEFRAHLDQVAEVTSRVPRMDPQCLTRSAGDWTITFDDGGLSAAAVIADELEKRGWRGWFFIATDFIDRPAFCSRAQLRDLHQRGHVLGSHSCSHPERISSCPAEQLQDEWLRSCGRLAEILGAPIVSASVPGGFYSTAVARAAARAGVELLFTSEPTTREFQVDRCRILGRFNIYRGMSASDAARLMSSPLRRWQQASFWNVKKAAKTVAGPLYRSLRRQLLRRAYAQG